MSRSATPDKLTHDASDAVATCRLIREAAAANWATPGRRGALVDLVDAAEVMVTGDLHGNRSNLQRIVGIAALEKHRGRHLVLQELVHGGPRDAGGGDRSHQLVQAACHLKLRYPCQVHVLLGNHELSEWTDRRIGKRGEEMNLLFRMGLANAYGAKAAEVTDALNTYYASLPVVIRTPNRIALAHSVPPAGLLEDVPLDVQAHEPGEESLRKGGLVYAICWGRDYRNRHVDAMAEWLDVDLVVTGHLPSDAGWSRPNPRQLIVDCSSLPAAYVLFATDRRLTLDELSKGVGYL